MTPPVPHASLALPPGWTVLFHDEIGSTNDEARRLAASGAAHGTIVQAARQSAGRGRRGRPWTSPEGNLYASIVLRPPPGAAVGHLAFVVAAALADGVAELAPALPLAVKWPNDLLIGGAKIAGILLETASATAGDSGWVVAGTGVNVVAAPPDVPTAATSLAGAGASDVTASDLLAAYARHLDGWFRRWVAEGFAPVRAAWLARAGGLDREIVVRLDRETFAGRFSGLDADGALLLATSAGPRRVTAGEVFLGPG